MDLNLSHVFIKVDDKDKALGFYRDLLGLEVRSDVVLTDFGGMRWLSLGAPSQPGIEIVLETPGDASGISAEDRDALAALVAKGHLTGAIFATDDCDATFERLRSAGAEVSQEPIDQPYGVRDCAFRDPAGNQIRISQWVR